MRQEHQRWYSPSLGRDMNVLVLGGRVIGGAVAHELVTAFVAARYTAEERHARRLAKVQAIEKRYR